MQAANMSEFRKEMKKYFDFVTEDHDKVIINRGNNKTVVVISLEEYNALTETNYLLSTKANKEHLLDSIKQAEQGKIIRKDLIEDDEA